MKRLGSFARAKVEAAAHEAANTALPRMKERFAEVCLDLSSAVAPLRLPLLCLPACSLRRLPSFRITVVPSLWTTPCFGKCKVVLACPHAVSLQMMRYACGCWAGVLEGRGRHGEVVGAQGQHPRSQPEGPGSCRSAACTAGSHPFGLQAGGASFVLLSEDPWTGIRILLHVAAHIAC